MVGRGNAAVASALLGAKAGYTSAGEVRLAPYQAGTVALVDSLQAVVDFRQRSQPQKVELNHTNRFDGLEFKLSSNSAAFVLEERHVVG